MDKRGGGGREYHNFLSKFLVSVPKNFEGDPSVLCFGNFPVVNWFMDEKGGVSKFTVENSFVSQCRKIS